MAQALALLEKEPQLARINQGHQRNEGYARALDSKADLLGKSAEEA